jgi:hypothetical protein
VSCLPLLTCQMDVHLRIGTAELANSTRHLDQSHPLGDRTPAPPSNPRSIDHGGTRRADDLNPFRNMRLVNPLLYARNHRRSIMTPAVMIRLAKRHMTDQTIARRLAKDNLIMLPVMLRAIINQQLVTGPRTRQWIHSQGGPIR